MAPEDTYVPSLVWDVTITLQDVAVQLGLSINGEAMTGLGRLPDPWGTCKRLFRRFIWMPYVEKDIATLIPSWVIEQQQLFVSNVPLIHFYMVEWHDGGQVLRQFGCAQPIPNPLVDITKVMEWTKRVQVGML
ncbi:hypothetical protein J1N35_014198 [Gossypium stocksii]|uniref:Aminotransferase-like plant mobile domain-containing protein n=1 Tax=Gossypium stocksii TaxID=47602 RepID=A0A9D3VTS6_9ROSI|nr:hypothetical protein J1N35_014198 [Gossypium stocksii]